MTCYMEYGESQEIVMEPTESDKTVGMSMAESKGK